LVVDEIRQPAPDRVAEDLDRYQHPEDEPEAAADEMEAAAEGGERRALLDLDDRTRETEEDEGENTRHEPDQQPDRDDRDEGDVDDDQAAVLYSAGDLAQLRWLLPVRMGERDRDSAAEEELAEQAGHRHRADREHDRRDFDPAGQVERIDIDLEAEGIEQTQGQEDDHREGQ